MRINCIGYTDSEIDQICGLIDSGRHVRATLREIVEETFDAYLNNESVIEICFISETIDPKEYATYEPYGESKYFTILNDQGVLRFQFWRRHLRRFLFEAELKEMPLLINVPYVNKLAAWRLRLGK